MKAPVHRIRQRVFSHGDGLSRSVAGQSGLAGLTAWQAAFQEGTRPPEDEVCSQAWAG